VPKAWWAKTVSPRESQQLAPGKTRFSMALSKVAVSSSSILEIQLKAASDSPAIQFTKSTN
jgi:hypothetical protein